MRRGEEEPECPIWKTTSNGVCCFGKKYCRVQSAGLWFGTYGSSNNTQTDTDGSVFSEHGDATAPAIRE